MIITVFTSSYGCRRFAAYRDFLRCFRDPIRVPRIENRVPRIRENSHRVPRNRENRVPVGAYWVPNIFLKKRWPHVTVEQACQISHFMANFEIFRHFLSALAMKKHIWPFCVFGHFFGHFFSLSL